MGFPVLLASGFADALPWMIHLRVVNWLCKIHDYPIVYKYTDSGKGESRTPEFLKMSPIGKIPVLKDGDFVLTER